MAYDISGLTLAALVQRMAGLGPVPERAIDWYKIDDLDFGR